MALDAAVAAIFAAQDIGHVVVLAAAAGTPCRAGLSVLEALTVVLQTP